MIGKMLLHIGKKSQLYMSKICFVPNKVARYSESIKVIIWRGQAIRENSFLWGEMNPLETAERA